jgi:oxalate decarboxylase/phosphoglucose isomerase-like protein (cupin superfamily)
MSGLVMAQGAGSPIGATGMTVKVGAAESAPWSVFEVAVAPGFDVGAHVHGHAEELFYVLDGELDLLAFEPSVRTSGDWRRWEAADGTKVVRGGPGCLMYVPAGTPHAFANPGDTPARMLFQVSPAGHETYLREMGELLAASGPPDQKAIAELRLRNDIQQLTPLVPGR